MALGPTATVMAYDLAQSGIQTIDIGHIDIEYEWYRMKASDKVLINNKHVQELTLDVNQSFETDTTYNSQIITKI